MISISSGHWVAGTGARDIIDEVTEARKVTKRVTEILRASGVRVNHIEDNYSKSKNENLSYLVNEHNKSSRGLDVSIHFNSSGEQIGRGIGTEVLYHSAENLAAKLSAAISKVSGLIDRGAKQRKELAFLSKTNKTAVLLEICFVNSTVDVALYRRDFEKICEAIAGVLCEHINITQKGTRKEDTKMETIKLLTETGRKEVRELLKSARSQKVIGSVHTNEKIDNYSDIELLSYQAAVINRTFK